MLRCSRVFPTAAPLPIGLRRGTHGRCQTRALGAEVQPPGDTSGSASGAEEVRIEYRGRQIRALRGSTLRTALLEGGATPHNGRAALINCRGLGTCGTCAVEVRGAVEPAQWTTQERLRLTLPPHSPPGNQRLRLACQVACQADLTVLKRSRFWGQGEEVLPDWPAAATGEAQGGGSATAAVAPLGQLEYVLDPRRPSKQL